ncbi:MAG: roadblock/LC7 domain-containing protein [Thermoplasmatota archaeon]
MTIKKEIEGFFKDYCRDHDVDAVALTSKNGIPIATLLKKKEESESFSTLSATIFGASEVIFSSFDKREPETAIVNSNDSVLLMRCVGRDTVLSLLGSFDKKEDLIDYLDEMSIEIQKIKSDKAEKEVLEV